LYKKLLQIINVDSDITDQLLNIYSEFIKYMRKKYEHNGVIHQLFTDFKMPDISLRMEDLYNIFTESGTL